MIAKAVSSRSSEGGAERPVSILIVEDEALIAVDLQDAVNNLRNGGAEAIIVAGRRVVTGSVIRRLGDGLEIDGQPAEGPWTFSAVGDPAQLAAAADLMTRSLRADPRVRSAGYLLSPALTLTATLRLRPFVYALSQ